MSGWRDQARCRPGSNIDPELFFPASSGAPADNLKIARAKAICKPCPVRHRCLEWAVQTRQEAGIWGGLTEKERLPLRRLFA
jgi:WhiB family redox-sensing transcriptional regulator